MYAKLSGVLLSLYLFYHHSPLNRSNLKAAFDTLALQQALPSRVGGTRWLPHQLKALRALVNGYPALILHLTQMQVPGGSGDAKTKAIGFLATLRRKDIIETAHFLLDVLFVLSKLSLIAQTVTATVADVHATLMSVLATLLSVLATLLSVLATLLSVLATLLSVLPTLLSVLATLRRHKECPTAKERGLDLDNGFHGEVMKGAAFSEQTRAQMIDNLISCLEGRFANCNSEVVQATSIACFKLWPEEADGYGEEAVATLTQHYGPMLREAGVDRRGYSSRMCCLLMCMP